MSKQKGTPSMISRREFVKGAALGAGHWRVLVR